MPSGPLLEAGYGVQAHHLLPRLRDQLSHDVAQHAWYGLKGAQIAIDGMPIYPGYQDDFGNDICGQHARHFGADLVITLIDIWTHSPGFNRSLGGIPWAPWAPVDCQPAPPPVIVRAREAEYPLQYSQFGMQMMADAGISCTYVPHGVATEIFRPGDKRAARAELGLPQEAFLCSMVAANQGQPSRKAFAENLSAFARFRGRHPEAALYLHTTRRPRDGVHLEALLESLGIPDNAVSWVDQYAQVLGLGEDYMAQVYQASDVLLAASCAEGFGLPLIESQACGTPVITTAFSAMSELTVNGITTEPVQLQWSPLGAWQAVPSVVAIGVALETIYRWGTKEQARHAEAGRKFVVENFDWDHVIATVWKDFLTRVEAECAIRSRRNQVREVVPA